MDAGACFIPITVLRDLQIRARGQQADSRVDLFPWQLQGHVQEQQNPIPCSDWIPPHVQVHQKTLGCLDNMIVSCWFWFCKIDMFAT